MKVGVLALQGAVREHLQLLRQAGVEAVPVKRKEQFADLDGLILPGGESTTIGKLMRKYDLVEPILEMHEQRKPLFGTCAGLILMAKQIVGQEAPHLPLLDITVRRNAFGRQVDSFEADLSVKGVADDFRAVFIRAPIIEKVAKEVEILAKVDDQIVAVQQDHLLGISFHPELTDDVRFHAYFVDMIRKSRYDNK